MTHYLIEYRFFGGENHEIRRLIHQIDNKFDLGYIKRKKPIPHVSFAGPLTTRNESKLIHDFHKICDSSPLCSFKIKGFGCFDQTNVVYIDIQPSNKLIEFRKELASCLQSYCTLRPYDYEEEFYFHATLAMKLSDYKFNLIKQYVDSIDRTPKKHYMLRAALIKNSKILVEYDFLQRKLLNRQQALNKNNLSRTFKLLEQFFDGKYDPNAGIPQSLLNTDDQERISQQDYSAYQITGIDVDTESEAPQSEKRWWQFWR